LTDKIDEHYQFLVKSNILAARKHRKAAAEINESLRATILEPILSELTINGELETMIQKVMMRELDPYSLAEVVAKKYLVEKTKKSFDYDKSILLSGVVYGE
jgi:LAO/AO transport system kinase